MQKYISLKTFAVLISLLLIGALSGPSILMAKEAPPVGGEPKPFTVPGAIDRQLSNGIPVTFVPFGRVPKTMVLLIVRAGNLNEGDDTWLADLTVDMMREGAAGMSGSEISRRASSMGGSLGTSTGVDETSFAISVLSEFTPRAIQLMANVVLDPDFPESEFDRIKADYKRSLAISRVQPRPQARQAFYKLLYGEHTYGRLYPDDGQLDGFTIDDLKAFHGANFGAARARIYVGGRFDEAAVMAALEEAFGAWAAGPEVYLNIPERTAGKRVVLIDRPGAEQSTVYLGLPVINLTDPDYVALQVTNTLLGGYFSSRITANIREDKGYTYSPRSSLSSRYHDTFWVQIADVTSKDTGAALKEIYLEINRLQVEPFPPAVELDAVKNYYSGSFILQNATARGVMGQLASIDKQGVGRDYIEGFIPRVFATTPADIARMARQHLRVEDMALVVVGDLALIQPQLEALDQLKGVEFDVRKKEEAEKKEEPATE